MKKSKIKFGELYYDTFYGTVVIPIAEHQGRFSRQIASINVDEYSYLHTCNGFFDKGYGIWPNEAYMVLIKSPAHLAQLEKEYSNG